MGISAGENNLAWSKGRELQITELRIPLALKLTSSTRQWFSCAVVKANPNHQHQEGLGEAGSRFHKRALLVVEPACGGEQNILKGKNESGYIKAFISKLKSLEAY